MAQGGKEIISASNLARPIVCGRDHGRAASESDPELRRQPATPSVRRVTDKTGHHRRRTSLDAKAVTKPGNGPSIGPNVSMGRRHQTKRSGRKNGVSYGDHRVPRRLRSKSKSAIAKYTPQEISAQNPSQNSKESAEAYSVHKVYKASSTVPAYFNDATQRQATRIAGDKSAGLEVATDHQRTDRCCTSLTASTRRKNELDHFVSTFGGVRRCFPSFEVAGPVVTRKPKRVASSRFISNLGLIHTSVVTISTKR